MQSKSPEFKQFSAIVDVFLPILTIFNDVHANL